MESLSDLALEDVPDKAKAFLLGINLTNLYKSHIETRKYSVMLCGKTQQSKRLLSVIIVHCDDMSCYFTFFCEGTVTVNLIGLCTGLDATPRKYASQDSCVQS